MKKMITRKLDFGKSGYYFIGLFVLVLLGFWPSYFSKFIDGTADFNFYFHFHAVIATLWLILLIVLEERLDLWKNVVLPTSDPHVI